MSAEVEIGREGRAHGRRAARRLGVLAALVAGGALATGTAGAVPFGADLNRPANNPFGCETAGILQSPLAGGGLIVTPSGQTSCTWTANGRLGDFAETLAVPRSGTVTQVRVKVGPVTGPMQVAVISALGTINPVTGRLDTSTPPACCQVRGLSQVFTPAPNGITTVNTNLPVITERRPAVGNIIRTDSLALSVLAPGVPVPAHNTGNFDALRGAPVGGIYTPALRAREERLAPAGNLGFQLLLNAELSTARCGGRPATIVGTPGRDRLRGTPGADVIAGLGGNDVILGLAGNDRICGGPGRDRLLGGGGRDVLLGDAGNDVLIGGAGNDRLLGGAGNDLAIGGGGRDFLDGGPGSRDRNRGGAGRDVCRRGAAAAC